MDVVLTMIDTAGIQDYIFGSNRLRENIGASYLVEQATRDWAYEALKDLGGHNIKDPGSKGDDIDRIDRSKLIESDGQRSELIYAGGGNTAILFRSRGDAEDFAWKLSLRILEEAPGLEIVIAHSEVPFEWERDGKGLHKKMDNLRKGRLAEKKRTQEATSTPLLGLGVTAECEATGLVAARYSAELEAEPRLVSRETWAKLKVTQKDKRDDERRNEAKKRLLDYLSATPNLLVNEFEFSDDLDYLGRTGGEESYIAVVHIDGNDMGKAIEDYVNEAKTNGEYIERMRNFSLGVERASREALVKTLSVLRAHVKPDRDPNTGQEIPVVKEDPPWSLLQSVPEGRITTTQRKQFRLVEEKAEKGAKARPCWPFRPLVFGGDDVTFVCNGQLGLSLATIYMKAFTEATRNQIENFQGRGIHTGAGVCIVKVHYPFRRAYDLSAELTKSAKRHLKDDRSKASALDWHISSTGLSGNLGAIRAQEYEIRDREQTRTLLMRPVRMRHASEWRAWEDFNRFVAAFNYDECWAGRRNKVKALREALRAGEAAVKEFLAIHTFTDATESSTQSQQPKERLPAPINTQWRRLCENGWEDNRCVYFDAIEAMDHHLILEEVKS